VCVRLALGVRILRGIELEIWVVYEYYIYIASKKKAREVKERETKGKKREDVEDTCGL
jgi:hypothetical protein